MIFHACLSDREALHLEWWMTGARSRGLCHAFFFVDFELALFGFWAGVFCAAFPCLPVKIWSQFVANFLVEPVWTV